MTNAVEMGMDSHAAVVGVVKGVPEYRESFQKVFGREPTIDDVAAAIATFERTVLSGDSAFDRFQAGDRSALSDSAQRGWELWNGKARCNTCHPFGTRRRTSRNKFHNIGVAAKGAICSPEGRNYPIRTSSPSALTSRARPVVYEAEGHRRFKRPVFGRR
jgi:cytochrome c peroxidase